MTGIDVPVPELHMTIHAPTITEIAYMGEEDFFMALQYLCIQKEALIQDETLLAQLSNFQVLMKVLEQSKDKQHKKQAIQTLLLLLLPNKQSIFLPHSIMLNEPDQDPVSIDDSNFDIFQEYVRQILCVGSIFQGDNIIYNPGNDRAKEIAAKIMAGRRKVAELKSKEEGKQSILTRYISILTIGTSTITLDIAKGLTLFQLFDLMDRYSAFVE